MTQHVKCGEKLTFFKKKKERKKSSFSVFKITLFNINQPSGVGNNDEPAYTE